MAFPLAVGLNFGQEKQTTTGKRHKLGTIAYTPDGRGFHYSFSGEAIGAGQLTMQKASTAEHDMDLAVQAAAAVGDNTISVTLGAAATTADQYADGTIYINDGAGEGHAYRIRTHAAAASSGTQTVSLEYDDNVREALTTATSLAGLMENPYKDVEIYDADDIDGPALGVAPTEVADNTYFWNQFSGYAAVLIEGTLVMGDAVEASQTTDGSVFLHDVSGNTDQAPLGTAALILAVDGDSGIIKLNIG